MNNGLIEAAVTVMGTIVGLFVKDYLDRRKLNLKTNLEKDLTIKKSISSILEEVKYELEADKTHYWVFSNGDITFSGLHLKKLSVLEESTGDTIPAIAHQFQLVPAKNFEVHLSDLNDSPEDYLVINVEDAPEEIKDLYSLYDVKKVIKFKVKDNRGKWVGILSAWYKTNFDISDGQIAFGKIQASRIGTIK